MADEVTVRVTGVQDFVAALRSLPAKLRQRALRNALAAAGRVVRNDAQRRVPVLSISDPAVQAGYRKPGTLRGAIRVRTSKVERRRGNVGVFVNVRPAKAGQRGARNPNDPFYWRWIEFGRTGRGQSQGAQRQALRRGGRLTRAVSPLPAVRFLQGAAAKLGEALRTFERVLGPQIERLAGGGKP